MASKTWMKRVSTVEEAVEWYVRLVRMASKTKVKKELIVVDPVKCVSLPHVPMNWPGAPFPYYYTFEANDPDSGRNLVPLAQASQGVTFDLGASDPAGSDELVGHILRPENGPFGGFEDFKFQPQPAPIDFSSYNKFTLDVYIPSSNDFFRKSSTVGGIGIA